MHLNSQDTNNNSLSMAAIEFEAERLAIDTVDCLTRGTCLRFTKSDMVIRVQRDIVPII